MSGSTELFAVAVCTGAIRSGTPVLLGALGEVVTQRSGILNLGLEGIMLMGAWAAVVATLHFGSPVFGFGAALGIGALLGLLHALSCIRFGANQVASGIALMTLGAGLSAFLGIEYVGQKIAPVTPSPVPGAADIPILGPVFFSHDVVVYAAYLLVPIVSAVLFRTRLGLAVQAVGEDPGAAAAAGVHVELVRYASTAFGGALAGLGGAYLSLVYAQGWIENITTGRGLIAVGLVIFASWSPWKAALGAVLFGGALSLQLRLQALGADVSPYLLGMVPYLLVTVVLVAATVRMGKTRIGIPAALGKPYIRQT